MRAFRAVTFDDLLRDVVVDGSRFAHVTGYRPPVAPDIAVERTARWLEAGG
ncbi:hypothetical protein BH23GEM2_BH23GEM2_21410 [soil metagenome]